LPRIATLEPPLMFLKQLPALLASVLVAFTASLPAGAQDAKKPELLVFAAASLTNVLGELSPAFEQDSGVTIKLSFAASSALARQIEGGAAADVFVSADQEWMDYLQTRNLLNDASRRDLVGNHLVLIAAADSKIKLKIRKNFPLLAALGEGRLSTGDPDSVPVGKYAKAALTNLGVWEAIEPKLVRAENVRSAMMFVSRGEAPLGIVYSTDAQVDPKVRVVDTFADNTHAPITYPAAAIRAAKPQAAAYLEYLSGAGARATWKKFGFVELPKKKK
jgi:molybdate transport system substrate-binding protein